MDVSSAVVVDEDIWMIEVNSTPVAQEQVNQMAEQLNKFKLLLNGYGSHNNTRTT